MAVAPLQAEDESHSFTLTSETNTATVTKLSPGHIYGFQVRARTAAGHGPYGGKVYFQTLPQGENVLQRGHGLRPQESRGILPSVATSRAHHMPDRQHVCPAESTRGLPGLNPQD